MFLNINNDLNYLMLKNNGSAEDRRKYEEFVSYFFLLIYKKIIFIFLDGKTRINEKI